MPKKRDLLHHLTRDELVAAVNEYDLPVADRRVKDQLVETLAGSRKVTVEDLRAGFKRERRASRMIVQAPMKLVDYVVAHELVHLVHEDHGREFWGRLGRVMPDYEERRERLRTIGVEVVW